MTSKQRNICLILALAAICGFALILIPPPVSGRWRAYFPPYPSAEGGPKWIDLEFRDGKMIYIGPDRPHPISPFNTGRIVARYNKIGFRKYRYDDDFTDEQSFSGTLHLGWLRSTVSLDDSPQHDYLILKRRFRKENNNTQQSGPAYPPQGVGSADP